MRICNVLLNFFVSVYVFLLTRPFTWYCNFLPLTLTLKFILLLKNFNLGHNFQTKRDGAFIMHMRIACDKTFHVGSLFFTLTLKFDILFKNFNLDCYLVMVAARRASSSSDISYFSLCLSVCVLILNYDRNAPIVVYQSMLYF